ncbi:MAG: hypothetical protein V7637_400 [Mycobacteriales bacterium]
MAVDPAPSRGQRRTASGWNWLLVVPLIGTLIPAFYNKANPKLFGIPFFYWYQMLWIPVTVALTLVVFRAARGGRP